MQGNSKESLKQKAISGIIWVSFQKFGTMGVSFISNIVLARLLTPEDFGCVGLLAIFIAISNVFVNGGFVSALIQKQYPSQLDYSTVFYWNIISSLFFYFFFFFTSPYIAQYYNIPILCKILRILSLVLFFNALSIVQINILRKLLLFKRLSMIQLISTSISIVVTIILAVKGFGIWSLVVQQLLTSIITAIIIWFYNDWQPRLVFSIKSLKELFGYGSFLLFSELLNSICDNIQGLIIGRKFTSNIMGYYSQAKKLEEVPTLSISYVVSQVTFPIFVKLQHNKNELHKAVKKSMRLMNFINCPLMILLIIIAEPLFILLFSEKWLAAVPYFQILCLSGIVNCMQSVNYQVVCAVGKSNIIFKWNIVKKTLGVILILIGVNWGVEGILLGMVISSYITFIINAIVATETTGYTIMNQIRDVMPIIIVAVLSAFIGYFVIHFHNMHNIIRIMLQIIIYIVVFLILSRIMVKSELKEYISIIKSYIKK